MWGDIRFGLRQALNSPTSTAAVVVTLILAIAANTTIFSIVNAVMFRALPFAEPERLVWVSSVRPDRADAPFSLPEFIDYRAQTGALTGLAAYGNWSANLTGVGIAERLQGMRMSANAFDVLGLRAVAGRLLRAEDDAPDATRVAVLAYGLWRRSFGGNSDVIGRTVRLNNDPYVVVGVLPPHFPFPLRDIDVVVPLSPDRDPWRFDRGSVNFLRLFGRLEPGNTLDRTEAELTAICRTLREQFPVEYARKDGVRLTPMREYLVAGHRVALLVLLGGVGLVTCIAFANLVNLLLVRATDRRREIAIRLALGATRWPLMRQLLVESAVLAGAGGVGGLAMAQWLVHVVSSRGPTSIPRLAEVGLDHTVLTFTVGLAVAATTLFSVATAFAVLRARASESLLGESRGSVGSRWQQRARHALVVSEITLALVVLICAAQLLQSIIRLQTIELGFVPDRVFIVRLALPPSPYGTVDSLTRFYERLRDRIDTLPGVESAGRSMSPLSADCWLP